MVMISGFLEWIDRINPTNQQSTALLSVLMDESMDARILYFLLLFRQLILSGWQPWLQLRTYPQTYSARSTLLLVIGHLVAKYWIYI